MTDALRITGAQVAPGVVVDLGIVDGRFSDSSAALPDRCSSYDAGGRVVLPALVDPHVHLDKTYFPARNEDGTLVGAIEAFREVKARGRTVEDIEARAERGIRCAIAHGVGRIRTHIDLGSEQDLIGLEAVRRVRVRYQDAIRLEITAMADPLESPEAARLLDTALAAGVDLIGGAPALSADPAASTIALIDRALEAGIGIDLHTDENEDPESLVLETFANRLLERGPAVRATASHCCALAFMSRQKRREVLARVRDAGIGIVTLPSCNLVLMGRGMEPAPRGAAPVKDILGAGIAIGAGSDNVADPFNPFGSYAPLLTAFVNAHVAQLTSAAELDLALEMVGAMAARAMGHVPDAIAPGDEANVAVFDAYHFETMVTDPPSCIATFHRGRLLASTRIEREWSFEP